MVRSRGKKCGLCQREEGSLKQLTKILQSVKGILNMKEVMCE